MSSLSADPADLFCALYDELDEKPFRDTTIFDWEHDDLLKDLSAWVEEQACYEAIEPATIASRIEGPDGQRARYAILRGLDRALANAHPWEVVLDGPLAAIRDRYVATGRLNTNPDEGALLPRFTDAWYAPEALEGRWQAFLYVVRVEPSDYAKLDHVMLANRFDPGGGQRGRDFDIGMLPLADNLSDLVIETVRRGASVQYRLAPTDVIRMRVSGALDQIDASSALVACAPEGTLDDAVLAEWLAAASRTPGRGPTWLLVGTGPALLGDTLPARAAPPNRAVMVSRRTAERMFIQDKRSRFTLNADQVRDWRLTMLPEQDLTEHASLGERSTVVETSVGRVAIVICEDLARLTQIGSELARAGVSLLFVPVFSKELREHFWEDAAAKAYANGMGATVVICNSVAVARARGIGSPSTDASGRPEWGTAMLRGPHGSEIVYSDGPVDVQCLHFVQPRFHP